MSSVPSTSCELSSSCSTTEWSFFWFLLRRISGVAESKMSIPGQYTPFSLVLSLTAVVSPTGLCPSSPMAHVSSAVCWYRLLARSSGSEYSLEVS